MKVGVLVSRYPAPSHTFIRREVAALRELGLAVETFSVRPGECLSEEDRREQAGTFTILPGSAVTLAWPLLQTFLKRPGRWFTALRTAVRHSLPGLPHRLRALVYFAEGLRLATEMERRGVRHVHNHFANPAAVAGLVASRYLGIGWSVTLHGMSDFAGPSTPLLALRVADASFVASATEWGRDRVLQTVGPGHASKIHVVRCGVDLARLPDPTRTLRSPGEPFKVLCVGRLSPEKGHVGLIEAVADLVRRGVDCRLILIGGGPEERAIRLATAALGLENRVELQGPKPEAEVLQAMARAHVFAMSSLMEGLPVVLMEALALELPVVAPAITGIPELVSDGETGLLYPAGDWKQLATSLELLAADPGLRVRLGRAGRERVLRDFDARTAAVPLARLLNAQAGRGGGITSR